MQEITNKEYQTVVLKRNAREIIHIQYGGNGVAPGTYTLKNNEDGSLSHEAVASAVTYKGNKDEISEAQKKPEAATTIIKGNVFSAN